MTFCVASCCSGVIFSSRKPGSRLFHLRLHLLPDQSRHHLHDTVQLLANPHGLKQFGQLLLGWLLIFRCLGDGGRRSRGLGMFAGFSCAYAVNAAARLNPRTADRELFFILSNS